MKDLKEGPQDLQFRQRDEEASVPEEASQLQRLSLARVLVIVFTERANVCGSN